MSHDSLLPLTIGSEEVRACAFSECLSTAQQLHKLVSCVCIATRYHVHEVACAEAAAEHVH